jgi:hypothetical protein
MCNNMLTKLQMTPKNGASESHIIVLVSDPDRRKSKVTVVVS